MVCKRMCCDSPQVLLLVLNSSLACSSKAANEDPILYLSIEILPVTNHDEFFFLPTLSSRQPQLTPQCNGRMVLHSATYRHVNPLASGPSTSSASTHTTQPRLKLRQPRLAPQASISPSAAPPPPPPPRRPRPPGTSGGSRTPSARPRRGASRPSCTTRTTRSSCRSPTRSGRSARGVRTGGTGRAQPPPPTRRPRPLRRRRGPARRPRTGRTSSPSWPSPRSSSTRSS
mmetsp:Transcript_29200/g.65497  ORF Transcript_29200/g.65497 Transcript_29200/m.65497 type:complete len:229 (+) Transcript_29200:249-935(+)